MSIKQPDPPRSERDKRSELADPIPDSFENVVGAVMRSPAKKNWRYEQKP